MRLSRCLGTLAALTVLLAGASIADAKVKPKIRTITKTERYDLSAAGARIKGDDPTCASACKISKDKTIDIGAVSFPAMGGGKKPATVTITARDDTNPFGKVRLSACQDTNGNGTCGESASGEPSADNCVAPGKTMKLAGASRAIPVTVFVYTAWGCPKFLIPDLASDGGGGTSGTVTVAYPSS